MSTKLTYFHLTGLGEPARLMLSAAGIPFEDNRLNKDEWLKLKPTLRWGQLPLLEIDGMKLCQSRAICRYIARKAKLTGSDDKEAALADMTVDVLDDFRQKIVPIYYKQDSPEREKEMSDAMANAVPFYFSNLQKQITENNGYLVAGKLTWADVMLVAYMDYVGSLLPSNPIANYPAVAELVAKVSAHDGIKKYLANRPKMPSDYRTLF